MIDVLVTCHPHDERIVSFPQVRGSYLAKHLERAGLRAQFRQLPASGVECEVLICCEYQCTMEWFDTHLAGPLAEIKADRMYCMAENSLSGSPEHFSRPYCEWFATRGGVLCHLLERTREPYEHWIGVGVDEDAVHPASQGSQRDIVLFDLPRTSSEDAAATFDSQLLGTVRATLPRLRLVGSGPADSPLRSEFDDWVEYGQEHAAYVAAAFSGALAYVPGLEEGVGFAIAEAQVAGACVVWTGYQVHPQMRVPEADLRYETGSPGSFVEALRAAALRDPGRVCEQAGAVFSYAAVVKRTRRAIGL
ncbi:MAG: hypothetical protein JWP02_3639 [Acidimicrobiales bacterium]|nr:hypothetical protein [Acidimicrobiales bacterium]